MLGLFIFTGIIQEKESEKKVKLEVKAEGLRSNEGYVLMELSDYNGKAVQAVRVRIADYGSNWIFRDIQAGLWAVRIFHDENKNGKLDTNFLGMPREGYGFSNNVRGRFGPPSFDSRLFEARSDTTISIKMIY
ncbi:MAG: DUF2141 domain-containing protein [Balneolales bacterium]|nr:DUF2141 domain-containing protein [Balneolales bacterium]